MVRLSGCEIKGFTIAIIRFSMVSIGCYYLENFWSWNLAITPAFDKMLRTVSEGCAPLANHSRTRSSFTVIWFSATSGLYVPTVSIKRPSRGARESATLIR